MQQVVSDLKFYRTYPHPLPSIRSNVLTPQISSAKPPVKCEVTWNPASYSYDKLPTSSSKLDINMLNKKIENTSQSIWTLLAAELFTIGAYYLSRKKCNMNEVRVRGLNEQIAKHRTTESSLQKLLLEGHFLFD
eukprot:scaffold2817_cov130-Cylindrotheca_fusiformis.AAC.5